MNTPVPHLSRRRKRLKYAAAIGVVLLVLLLIVRALFLSAHAVGQTGAAGGRRGGFAQFTGPQPVQAAAAVRGDVPVTLSALGTVTPLATVTVRTQVSGHLVQLGFAEGQMVKQGQFLAEIDPRPFQVALEQAEGQFARDQGLLHQAQADLVRYKNAVTSGAITAQQLDDQQYLVEQYGGTVKSDQAQVDNAKLNLSYCHITAPVAGRVGLRQVDIGNYVQTADANGIVVITEPSPISVIFSLPQDQVPQVLQRVNAGAKLPVTLFDRSNTNELAQGYLAAVDNMVNTTTGTVQLRAVFQNKDGRLFPNEFVNAALLVDTLKDTVVVPVAAIQRGVPGTFVYLVNSDDSVSLRVVSVGPADGERVAVLSGLKPGDEVVTDGAEQLKDGAKVTLPAAGTAVPPATAQQDRKKGPGRRGASFGGT